MPQNKKNKRTAKNKVVRKKTAKKVQKKKATRVSDSMTYSLNPDFPFLEELRSLILKASPEEKDKLINRINGLGRIKLAVVAGVFLNSGNSADTHSSEVDLFIVGEDISKDRLRSFVRSVEADIGQEIRLGLMEKDEFDYRYNMFDRFVRVLLEGPHDKLINKLEL